MIMAMLVRTAETYHKFRRYKEKSMNIKSSVMILCLVIVLAGCSTAPSRPEAKEVLSAQVKEAVAVFKEKDPGYNNSLKRAMGTRFYRKLPKALSGSAGHTAKAKYMNRAGWSATVI
jgi:hypothetical protein